MTTIKVDVWQRLIDEDISLAFAFGRRKCGAALGVENFHELIARADRKRIWSYVGMHPWMVLAVLLTLSDFEARNRYGEAYVFRFAFKTPKGAGRSAVLTQPTRCLFTKYFDG